MVLTVLTVRQVPTVLMEVMPMRLGVRTSLLRRASPETSP
tara:strand:+ start:231 stop:350 length:120 start_codon:yes stop_codon:yes gene_type:complete